MTPDNNQPTAPLRSLRVAAEKAFALLGLGPVARASENAPVEAYRVLEVALAADHEECDHTAEWHDELGCQLCSCTATPESIAALSPDGEAECDLCEVREGFYSLTLKERDYERVRSNRIERERDDARAAILHLLNAEIPQPTLAELEAKS